MVTTARELAAIGRAVFEGRAFVFHHPETGLHLAGTVNQARGRGHARAVRAILAVIRAARR